MWVQLTEVELLLLVSSLGMSDGGSWEEGREGCWCVTSLSLTVCCDGGVAENCSVDTVSTSL